MYDIPIPSPTELVRWQFSGRSAIMHGIISGAKRASFGEGRNIPVDTRYLPPAALSA